MRRSAALGDFEGYDPKAAFSADREYAARVVDIHFDTKLVDVTLNTHGQPVRNVRVLMPSPCNDLEVEENFPRKGDVGLVGFIDGSIYHPVWKGWLLRSGDPVAKPQEGRYRKLHRSGVETTIDADGTVSIRTKVDPVTGQAANGAIITIGPDDAISIDVPIGKTISMGGGDDVLVKKSWLTALETRLSAMESALVTSINAVPGGAAVSITMKAAFDAASATYEPAKASGATQKLKGG